jgi:hypothetical protein
VYQLNSISRETSALLTDKTTSSNLSQYLISPPASSQYSGDLHCRLKKIYQIKHTVLEFAQLQHTLKIELLKSNRTTAILQQQNKLADVQLPNQLDIYSTELSRIQCSAKLFAPTFGISSSQAPLTFESRANRAVYNQLMANHEVHWKFTTYRHVERLQFCYRVYGVSHQCSLDSDLLLSISQAAANQTRFSIIRSLTSYRHTQTSKKREINVMHTLTF